MDLWGSPNYQWTKRKRFENVGIVELRFSVAKGKITEAQITGDFWRRRYRWSRKTADWSSL